MSSLLKNLLGNGSKDQETVEAMRTILREMEQERGRHEQVVERVQAAIERLEQLGEPIAKAGNDVDAMTSSLSELKQRLAALAQLADQYQAVAERAEVLAQDQGRSEARIAEVVGNAQQITATYEQIGGKLDLALDLKDRIEAFLEVDRPFQLLRGDADGIRTQIESTGEQMARLREQHDRLLDGHKLALSKMEALDRRREDLGRDLQDKERRVSGVEQAVRGMDGIQQTVEDVRRQVGTLKALGDSVAQKTAGLEAQRDAVDSAVARADQLDRTMRQIDTGMRQVEENERTLNAVQEQVTSLQKLHETVVDRSGEIAQLQRQADQQAQSTRQDLATVRGEMKKTMEAFEFESKGMESVGQRVADLRGELSDLEARFKGVSESSLVAGELRSQTQSLTVQLQGLTTGVGHVDDGPSVPCATSASRRPASSRHGRGSMRRSRTSSDWRAPTPRSRTRWSSRSLRTARSCGCGRTNPRPCRGWPAWRSRWAIWKARPPSCARWVPRSRRPRRRPTVSRSRLGPWTHGGSSWTGCTAGSATSRR